jgi:hypothetical protein
VLYCTVLTAFGSSQADCAAYALQGTGTTSLTVDGGAGVEVNTLGSLQVGGWGWLAGWSIDCLVAWLRAGVGAVPALFLPASVQCWRRLYTRVSHLLAAGSG